MKEVPQIYSVSIRRILKTSNAQWSVMTLPIIIGSRLIIRTHLRIALISVAIGSADVYLDALGILDDAIQFLESLLAVDELATLLIIANEDAALGVVSCRADMNEDTIKPRHAKKPWQPPSTNILIVRHLAKLWGDDRQCHIIFACGDSRLAEHFLPLYLVVCHALRQPPVRIFQSIADILPVDIYLADSVFRFLVQSLDLYLHNHSSFTLNFSHAAHVFMTENGSRIAQ